MQILTLETDGKCVLKEIAPGDIRDLLSALSGADRLDASAIKNISSGGQGGLSPWQTATSNYSASAGQRLRIDASGGNIIISLPANPSQSDPEIWLSRIDSSSNSVLIRSSNKKIASVLGRDGVFNPASICLIEAIGFVNDEIGFACQHDRLTYQGVAGQALSFTRTANGDKNGLFHYVGTVNATARRFTSPVTLGQISLLSSSTDPGSSTVGTLVDRESTDFATQNLANSWVAIDLGASRLFSLSSYTLKSRSAIGSDNLLSWVLLGTNSISAWTVGGVDGATWTLLDTVNSSTLLSGINQWGNYQLSGQIPTFRYYRLLQTGLNSSGRNTLTLGELEFYGSLMNDPAPSVSVAAGLTSISEGNTVGNSTNLIFTRSGVNTLSPLVVDFTVGGTAVLNTDYTASGTPNLIATAGAITIPQGSSSTTLTVTTIPDVIWESDKTIAISISASAAYSSSGNSAVISILDDDNVTQLTFSSLTDTNGLFYHAGTKGYRSAWVNPAPDRVRLLASSTGGSSQAITVLSNRSSDAAGFVTNDVANSWLAIDLGSSRRLRLSSYTIATRNVATPGAPRNWIVQVASSISAWTVGGVDGAAWTTVDTRTNNSVLAESANSQGNFTLASLGSSSRYLRILQTGQNAASNNTLGLSELELYGDLIDNAYASLVLADSPLFFLQLDEPTGTAAADSSYNGNNCTFSQSTTAVAGLFSTWSQGAKQLAGNSLGTFAIAAANLGTANFTIELSFATTSTGAIRGLIGFGSNNGLAGTSGDKDLIMTTDGKISFYCSSGSFVVLTSPLSYNDGLRHHLVATMGTLGMRLYIDGLLVASNSTTTSASYNGFWRVGYIYYPGSTSAGNYYWSGTLDDVSVYLGRQLDLAQVQERASLLGVAATVTLTVSPSAITEGNATGNTATYTFTRTNLSISSPLTVNFSVGGTASFSTDYNQSGATSFDSTVGSVIIAANQTSATVSITTIGDTVFENSETVTLTLSASPNYAIGTTGGVTLTITNDDNSNYSNLVLAQNPLLYLKLDDASGTTAADSSGNTRTFNFTSSLPSIAGLFNSSVTARSFNGATNGNHSTAIAASTASTFTIEVCVRTSASLNQAICCFSNGTLYDRDIYFSADGKINCRIWNGSEFLLSSASSYNNNQSYHIAVTLGANGWFIYINGAQVAFSNAITSSTQSFSGTWYLGRNFLGGNQFNGTIDEFSVTPSQLTAAQILTRYNALLSN